MKKHIRKKLHLKDFAEYGIEFEAEPLYPVQEFKLIDLWYPERAVTV
jgi:hypothetical protein